MHAQGLFYIDDINFNGKNSLFVKNYPRKDTYFLAIVIFAEREREMAASNRPTVASMRLRCTLPSHGKGRGARATGGRDSGAQTPRPALCLLSSLRRKVSFPHPQSSLIFQKKLSSKQQISCQSGYNLFYIYRLFVPFLHQAVYQCLLRTSDIHLESFEIGKGSFATSGAPSLNEIYN